MRVLMTSRLGFTLLELLIVIGIMGLLGTVSVSGFRGLRKGIEDRGVMQTVNEFVRAAYRRALIDRAPTAVYCWNETISDETAGKKLVVVGRAVAVRRSGRISKIDGKFLVDEFGDLEYEVPRDEEGEVDPNSTSYEQDPGRYLYKVGDQNFARSVISSSTVPRQLNERLMTQPEKVPYPKIQAYAFYLKDPGGITWKTGDAYGFEFAELTLPKNYIFGSSYSTSVQSPEKNIQVLTFSQGGSVAGGNVTVSGLQLDKSGAVAFKSIGTSANPTKDR